MIYFNRIYNGYYNIGYYNEKNDPILLGAITKRKDKWTCFLYSHHAVVTELEEIVKFMKGLK